MKRKRSHGTRRRNARRVASFSLFRDDTKLARHTVPRYNCRNRTDEKYIRGAPDELRDRARMFISAIYANPLINGGS